MKFFFYSLFLLCGTLYSQSLSVYTPIDTNNIKRKEVLRYLTGRTQEVEKKLHGLPSSNKKIIKKFAKSRKEMLEELTSGSTLVYDAELEDYLNSVLTKLADANGLDSRLLKVFLSRDTQPNAFSMGDGNFVFNISLLNRLENEDELYFIMGHELAHYQLKHFEKQMISKMELSDSDEYKAREKMLKKTKYRKFTTSVALYREFVYDDRAEGRKKELEADATGYAYVKNIVADPANILTALEKLDTLSPSELYKIDLNFLKEHFSSDNMPFEDEWANGYDFSKYNYQRGKVDIFGISKDSMRSHPEKQERISKLSKLINITGATPIKKVDGLKILKEKLAMEDVYAHYCLQEYGRGIYLILQIQQARELSDTEKQFYSHMLGLFYEKLAEARKIYEFKKYVDDVDFINYSQEYILFLTILDNMRSSQLSELSNKYRI